MEEYYKIKVFFEEEKEIKLLQELSNHFDYGWGLTKPVIELYNFNDVKTFHIIAQLVTQIYSRYEITYKYFS